MAKHTSLLSQPLSDAARLMWDCDCGALPVVNDNGEVCAMITDRDAWFRGAPFADPMSGYSPALTRFERPVFRP
jgi:hypothetical protein